MARPKKTSAVLDSIDQCNAAMRKLLVATTDLEITKAKQDAAVTAAMKPYEKPLQRLTDQEADLKLQLQNYYMTHVKEFEADGKKSHSLQYGVLGRRKGQPTLKLLNRSWTWAAVTAKVSEMFGKKYLRLRDPELNKELVREKLTTDQQAECGMKVTQEERFYVELFRPDKATADPEKEAK